MFGKLTLNAAVPIVREYMQKNKAESMVIFFDENGEMKLELYDKNIRSRYNDLLQELKRIKSETGSDNQTTKQLPE